MRVAVIGCGPAGLAAAWAAQGHGADVTIFAPKQQTPQYGPLLLQRPIPGITTNHPFGTIHQIVIGGSILDYRYKLYGDINININGDQLQPYYHAWNHRETYDALWRKLKGKITNKLVTPEDILNYCDIFDLVVSTANSKRLCIHKDRHHFESKEVAIAPFTSYPHQPADTIIFNAGADYSWVRSSLVFGVPVTEWPMSAAPPDARVITKPISTTCSCYPRLLRTGRFGAWHNETWVDTAYWDVYSAIASAQRRTELGAVQ